MRVAGGVLFMLLWLIYIGQVISVVNLPLARRLGLQEPAETIDAVYARDTAGTARWTFWRCGPCLLPGCSC